jgi:EpsI family protein
MTLTTRTWVLTIFCVVSAGVLTMAEHGRSTPLPQPLFGLPLVLGDWHGRALPAMEARVVAVAGVDDYLNRIYQRDDGVTSLYIGYYASQQQGDSIHSPMNCLPGSGWQPLQVRRVSIPDSRSNRSSRLVTVNDVTIQKGDDRQIVLYWYQGQGRIVASEYLSKAWLFFDAVRTGRTDAALIRIVTPVQSSDSIGDSDAERRAKDFAAVLLPHLEQLLPR